MALILRRKGGFTQKPALYPHLVSDGLAGPEASSAPVLTALPRDTNAARRLRDCPECLDPMSHPEPDHSEDDHACPDEITTAQLACLIGMPTCPAVINVCLPGGFHADPRLIGGARHFSHTHLPSLQQRLAGRSAIIMCQKGRKHSQAVASAAQAKSDHAQYLAGGLHAWREAGAPTPPLASVPFDAAAPTCWIIRTRLKIDRIACPRLIRRFVARFLFVAASKVAAAAQLFDATRFDIKGADFCHEGPRYTFDMMIERLGLTTP